MPRKQEIECLFQALTGDFRNRPVCPALVCACLYCRSDAGLALCHCAEPVEKPVAGRPAGRPRGSDDLLMWITFGVILGGRLGYVIFYNPGYFLAHPNDILAVWQGGMAFHGGLLGLLLPLLFSPPRDIPMLSLGDMVAAAVPSACFSGAGKFHQQRIMGRVTQSPWGVVFPNGGPLPRHPSQLYEAGLEGLFCLSYWAF